MIRPVAVGHLGVGSPIPLEARNWLVRAMPSPVLTMLTAVALVLVPSGTP